MKRLIGYTTPMALALYLASFAVTPLVLYVYRCTVCGHEGNLHLPESSPEVTTACSACGAEVLAEWDGGVELATNQPQ